MIGPSAIGSENGTPTSMTSAPAFSSAARSSSVAARDGCPAVTYGTSARRPSRRSSANRSASRSDEVVTDTDTVPICVLRLDDRAPEHPLRRAVGEVHQVAGEQHVALVVTHDADDRPRQHLLERIYGVHDSELEGVEHHERPDRIDAGEIDEGLDEHRVHAATRVIAHLLH